MGPILVRMPNWLGDAVMALPALDDLAAALPGTPIAVACRPGLMDLFRAHPAVSALVDADRARRWHVMGFPEATLLPADADPGGDARLRQDLLHTRHGRFALGVLFTNSFSSAWWLFRGGATLRAGYARDGRRLLLNRAVACPAATRALHMTAYYRALVAATLARPIPGRPAATSPALPEADAAGAGPVDPVTGLPVPRPRLPAAAAEGASALLQRLGVRGRYAVMAPVSAGGAVKDWPAESYAELAARIAASGCAVLLTGAPDQEPECEDIRRLAMGAGYHQSTTAPREVGRAGVYNLAGETALATFLGLLSGAWGFVGGDSGGAHAAAALGARTVAIYGVTEPSRTRQLGARVAIVGKGGGSLPKLRTASTRERARRALASITVAQVWEAWRGLGKADDGTPGAAIP